MERKDLALDSEEIEEDVKDIEGVLSKAKDPWLRDAAQMNLMELYVENDQPEKAASQIRRMIDENLENIDSN